MTDEFESRPIQDSAADPMRQSAAVFLSEVLGMEDSASQLAPDLSTIKRDSNASIYTIQLDSSVGPAAFLVYAYLLEERGGDGHTGRELFESGLTTLQQAAQRETPGPRAVAHAEDGNYAFILATTPGTYRALTGETGSRKIEASTSDLLPVDDAASIRSDLAQELLNSLKAANEQATNWLQAIQVAGQAPTSVEEDLDDVIEFTEDETELALFLLDDDSIGNLLRALNLLVSTAQQRAYGSLNEPLD
jgi:hypothetical protein